LIALSVGNAGVIPPDVVPHLFTPFQRGDSPKAGDGLGLGLFIAQQIARAHGGDITVASCASEGTLFRVELPRYAPGATARLLPDHPLEAGEHEPARRA
jgi:C4-dicarboxylate-specific signal transduction histidine kinase